MYFLAFLFYSLLYWVWEGICTSQGKLTAFKMHQESVFKAYPQANQCLCLKAQGRDEQTTWTPHMFGHWSSAFCQKASRSVFSTWSYRGKSLSHTARKVRCLEGKHTAELCGHKVLGDQERILWMGAWGKAPWEPPRQHKLIPCKTCLQ